MQLPAAGPCVHASIEGQGLHLQSQMRQKSCHWCQLDWNISICTNDLWVSPKEPGVCSPPLVSLWVFTSSLLCLSRMERGIFSFISIPINTIVFCEVFVYMSLLSSLLSGEPLIYLLCFSSTGVDRGSYGLTALFRASGRCWYHSN